VKLVANFLELRVFFGRFRRGGRAIRSQSFFEQKKLKKRISASNEVH